MNAVLTVHNDILSSDNLDDLTRIDRSTPGDGGQLTCFAYDGLDRLKTPWTENASCANYTATTADGPAGFNAQYAYAANGVPTSVTNLGTATPSAGCRAVMLAPSDSVELRSSTGSA